MIKKLVSGGQTGVDRGALDAAIALGIPCGGWCPNGRRAEDGQIPDCYPLTETPTDKYPQRTEMNVRDSDGTLILAWGELSGGTLLTKEIADSAEKPCLVVNLVEEWDYQSIGDWFWKECIAELNVAGPRESNNPGIQSEATEYLKGLLEEGIDGCLGRLSTRSHPKRMTAPPDTQDETNQTVAEDASSPARLTLTQVLFVSVVTTVCCGIFKYFSTDYAPGIFGVVWISVTFVFPCGITISLLATRLIGRLPIGIRGKIYFFFHAFSYSAIYAYIRVGSRANELVNRANGLVFFYWMLIAAMCGILQLWDGRKASPYRFHIFVVSIFPVFSLLIYGLLQLI